MVAPDSLMEPPVDRPSSQVSRSPPKNGNHPPEARETKEHKPPSYVALACCISGYTTLVYDSKQRQGLRSRPASPIQVDGTEFKTRAHTAYAGECGNFLTHRSNNCGAIMQAQGKGASYALDFLNGCSGLHSPRHVANMTTTKENMNYTSSGASEGFPSFSTSSPHYSFAERPLASNQRSTINGNGIHGSKLIAPTNISQQLSPSSFIVQRVERLYGPGALAQGFYTLKKGAGIKTLSTNEVPQAKADKTDIALPVLKLLRPEFRAQLTVANRKGRTSAPEKINAPSSSEEVKVMENERLRDAVDASAHFSPILHEEAKDGIYFLKLHAEQVKILEDLAETGEKDLHQCGSEEGCGVLRSAAGKARLLVAQKLNQFKGLCHKNIEQSQTDDFPTTNEDLAGFWDMVMIQVEDILSQFKKIEVLKNNDWMPEGKEEDGAVHKKGQQSAPVKKVVIKKVDAKSKAAARARDEARRKLIEERRQAMRARNDPSRDDVVLVYESNEQQPV